MALSTILALCALAGSIVLVLKKATRAPAVAGLVASGLEVAIAFNLISLSIGGLSLSVLLGAVLAAVGLLVFFKVTDRNSVAAATVVALVGVLQVLAGLNVV